MNQEGKGAIKWTRLSCRSLAANVVRLQLCALAYNLSNVLRTSAMPMPINQRLIDDEPQREPHQDQRAGLSHGRYVTF